MRTELPLNLGASFAGKENEIPLRRLVCQPPAAAGAVQKAFFNPVGRQELLSCCFISSSNLQLFYGYKQPQIDKSVIKAQKASLITFSPGRQRI